MIRGTVTASIEATVRLLVRGPDGSKEEIAGIIDTGFNAFLTLPPPQIARLALPFAGPARVTLADGSEVELRVYEATVLWDGRWRDISVLAAEGGALWGMSLLYGHEVRLQIVEGGDVTIEALPQTAS